MSREAKLIEDSLRPWGEASAPRWDTPGPKTKAARCYLHVFACQAPMSQVRHLVVPRSRRVAGKQVTSLSRPRRPVCRDLVAQFVATLPAGTADSPEPSPARFDLASTPLRHAEPSELAQLIRGFPTMNGLTGGNGLS